RVAIVSGRSSEAVVRRARELQVDLVIQGVTDKGATLETVCGQLGLEAAAWCAVGDDWLDLPLLSRTGLAAAPADAVAEVRQRVDYVTEAPGGQGVVHQVVEWLLRLQGRWETAWSLLAWPHPPPTLPQANG
ncbi:MAG: HAD hydrolase family protein, partial [Gemmataceae bacterium]|nr:HAD hydrolase family protein [Gemmataceae bacterium]